TEQKIAGFGRESGENGNLGIDAAGTFEIHFDLVGPAGREEPDDFSLIAGIAHERGEHGIDAPIHAAARVAAAVAFAECLVGFIHKNKTLAQSADQPENTFDVAFGAADPAIAKIIN